MLVKIYLAKFYMVGEARFVQIWLDIHPRSIFMWKWVSIILLFNSVTSSYKEGLFSAQSWQKCGS